jgi:dolichol-phosphate mannosyltransferase
MRDPDSFNSHSAIHHSQPKTIVAVATYNEIENLPSLTDAIVKELPDADILVIDDNSPDGTGRWCDDQAANNRRLHCLHRPVKQGLGSATLAGARWALDHNFELFITMDADWSHDPRHLPELVHAAENADVAIGSRYCSGGAIDRWPLSRRIMSRTMNKLSRTVLRLPVHDSSGAFRAYRASALRAIDVSKIQAAGYSYLEEILWHLRRAGATFAEVPITFHERRAGRSKINLGEALSKITTLARLAVKR